MASEATIATKTTPFGRYLGANTLIRVVDVNSLYRILEKATPTDLLTDLERDILEIGTEGGGGGSSTNLTTTQTSTTVDVVSSTGTDATLPQAIAGGDAGVMSGADKTKVDNALVVTTPTVNTPSGTTSTFDWDDGDAQTLDLGSASGNVTLTLSNPVSGASYLLKIIQGATARTVILPSSVLIPSGSAPNTLTISTTDNDIDVLTLYYDGANYLAQLGQVFG